MLRNKETAQKEYCRSKEGGCLKKKSMAGSKINASDCLVISFTALTWLTSI